MPNFDIVKRVDAEKTFRVASVMGMFDLQTEKVIEHFSGELDLSGNWQIGVIYGASGTGKTTIAKQLFPDNYFNAFEYFHKSVIDDMPENKSVEQITSAFNSVGFATVWSWLKPFNVLSTGEQMRVNIARCLLSDSDLFVFDEYTSVVNREVVKISSNAISKSIRKTKKQFIAVSCHSDIVEWLEPDWVFCTDTMKFARGSLHRPKINISIYETHHSAWQMFKKYHYLNDSLNKSARCFVATINEIPVAFFAVLHFAHGHEKKFKRGHRLVVLPDYQGIGIGHLLSTTIADYYKRQGFRFIIRSATKSLFKQRQRDERWRVVDIGRTGQHGGKSTPAKITLNKTTSGKKITFAYEYVGEKNKV
jgi:energy-coupling factor transporter ATP-binding protein EcfA2